MKLSDQVKADLGTVVDVVDNAELIHGIKVTGHADQIGPTPYNEQLAMRRAQAVKATSSPSAFRLSALRR